MEHFYQWIIFLLSGLSEYREFGFRLCPAGFFNQREVAVQMGRTADEVRSQ